MFTISFGDGSVVNVKDICLAEALVALLTSSRDTEKSHWNQLAASSHRFQEFWPAEGFFQDACYERIEVLGHKAPARQAYRARRTLR